MHHIRAFSSGGERFPDTEEVTSSNLVTPTKLSQLRACWLWAAFMSASSARRGRDSGVGACWTTGAPGERSDASARRDRQAAWLRVVESGVVAILGHVALSRWGLWQSQLGLNWAFFSPRCGIWGRGRANSATTPDSATPWRPGLPRPPIPQRRPVTARLRARATPACWRTPGSSSARGRRRRSGAPRSRRAGSMRRSRRARRAGSGRASPPRRRAGPSGSP